jgi:histidine triad (HIT) family protein
MHDIFEKIIRREIPSKIFHETDEVIVIQDIRPKARVHLLIIPKKKYKNFYETPPETLAMLDQTVKKVAEMLEIPGRFEIEVHNGLGQEIEHVHYHFMSDRGSESLKFR